jgi:hypothetical protein
MEYAQSSIIDLIYCINIGCPERQIKIHDLLVPGQAAIIQSKRKQEK